MTYKDFDYKSIKQLIAKIRKCKTCHGFVQTSDHDGMYIRLQKKDLIAMINEAPELCDKDKFDIKPDEKGDLELWIN